MKKTIVAFIVVSILSTGVASGVEAKAPRDGRKFTASWYTGSYGACGKLEGNYVASKFYACGAHLTLTKGGKQVKVTVLDRCQCGIDMAPSAFKKFAPLAKGLVTVRVYRGW